jgi:hypothetical protein
LNFSGAPVSDGRMRLVIFVLLVSMLGCGRARKPTEKAAQTDELRAHEAAQAAAREPFYERLRPFERPSLETFGSDAALEQYLDAAAFLDATREARESLGAAPSLPTPLPRRARPAGLNADNSPISYRQMIGVLPAGPFPERLPRLVRQDARVYSLYDNQLRSFDVVAGPESLRLRSSLTLGTPIPVPVSEKGTFVDSKTGKTQHYVRALYPDGAFTGVMVADYLFVSGDELVVVGNRQDRSAIEIIRVAIASGGELRRKSSHLVYYQRPQVDGYHARLVDGALVIYLCDELFYTAQATPGTPTVYALPGIAEGDSGPVYNLVRGEDVYRPLLHAERTRLHTLLRCDLRAAKLACGARAVAGPGDTAHHMGKDAVYLWLVGWRGEGRPLAGSFLYRLPFDGSEPGVVRVHGEAYPNRPALHDTDGALHAIVSALPPATPELLRVPLGLFATKPPTLDARSYRPLQDPTQGERDGRDARFVGDHLVWGSEGDAEGYFMRGTQFARTIELVALRGGGARSVPIDHAATYVDEFEGHVLVTGTDGWHLHTSLIAREGGEWRVVAKNVFRDAVPKLARHGNVSAFRLGDTRWLLLDLSPIERANEPTTEARLPLQWSAASPTLQPAAIWSVPVASRSRLQPPGSEVVSLDAARLAVRIQDQLRVYRFDPLPILEQTFNL